MMKTRKYIAVIFAAMVMGISGCNDDLFLEEHFTRQKMLSRPWIR